MTVKQLIAALSALPPNATIVLSKDGEGNGYSPLSPPLERGIYRPDSTWSGERIDPADRLHGDVSAIFLRPVS